MKPLFLRPGGWLFRIAGWPFWGWGTWQGAQGRDLFEGKTIGDALLLFTCCLPVFPVLFLVLTFDLARLARSFGARRHLGPARHERHLAEHLREPEVPGLFSWPARIALLALPLTLFWGQHLREVPFGRNGTAAFLSVVYSSVFAVILLGSDADAATSYRKTKER